MWWLNLIKKQRLFLLLILLTVPSVLFLIKPGYFLSDDGEWMVIRFSAFFQVLRDGQFPVRFLSRLNYGYGYPVANFLYPGFMYIATPLHLLGFNFVDSVKIIFISSMFGSGVFSFLWLRRKFQDIPAFFGSLYYIYAPYHLYDLTKRGSIGECFAFAVIPFILWQVERRSVFWISLGIFFLILSHNTLSIIFLFLLFFYLLLSVLHSNERRPLIIKFAGSLILGFGLSCFFILPAIYDLKYTIFYQTSVSDWKSYFAGLDIIGISTLFILLIAALQVFWSRNLLGKNKMTILFLAFSIISLFLSIKMSSFLWNVIPVEFVQFPFRFLSLTIISMAFLTSFVISRFQKKYLLILGIFLIILTLISSIRYVFPKEFFGKEEGFYSTNEGTTTVRDEYMPIWSKRRVNSHYKDKIEILNGDSHISNLFINQNLISFRSSSETPVSIRINIIYFPGWIVRVNDKNTKINYQNDLGLIEFKIPPGINSIVIKFIETPVRLISDLITLLSFLFLIGLSLKSNFGKK